MKKQLLFEFIKSLFRKMYFRIAAFAFLTLLTAQSSFAQQWPILGNEQAISSVASSYTSIAVVNNGVDFTSYVAYTESGVPKVKKRLSDGTWVQVGANLGTSASYTQIYADPTGNLYVAYIDLSAGSKLAIQKYDYLAGTWNTLNPADSSTLYVSTGNVNQVSSKFSGLRYSIAFDSFNTPYVAFTDAGLIPYVKKFNSNTSAWETIGAGPATSGIAALPSLAIDSTDKPWLLFTRLVTTADQTGALALFSFNGTAWTESVNPTPISNIRQSCIANNGANKLCIAMFDINSANKTTIVYFDKTAGTWSSKSTLSTRDGQGISLINDTTGNVYCSYIDKYDSSTYSQVVRVHKLATDGTSWTELTNSTATRGIDEPTGNVAIAISNASYPYMVYTKANSNAVVTPIARFFVPLIYTKPITNITSNSATTGGEISSDGGSPITERGIVYGTNANPTVADTKIIDPSIGIGSFASTITGLLPAVDYHVRSYAITGTQTMYGNDITFSITTADPTNVKITDNGTTVILDNGIVKATINKNNASVSSLIYNGLELIQGGYNGGSIYWSWNMSNYQNPSGCTYSLVTNPASNNFNSAEIKLHMTWDGTTTTAAMDVDVYYSLQRNVSGLYASATLSHPAAYPALPGGEWRMASYPNPRFNWLSVDSLRNLIIPSGSDSTAAVAGAPPENYLITSGPFTNKYECKYDYSADFGAIDTWGWSSTADNVGLWVTAPSKEYYPGGPMKRELMCHQAPVLLNMLGGTHYGQGNETGVAAGEDWQKTYGPFLIYCNKVAAGTANAPIALWEDAKTQAKTEQAAWPYSWHNNTAYAKESGRGTVTGKLVINDANNPSASAANTWVGLAIPPTGSGSVTNFQAWSKNYQFWVKTDANGNFTIPHVLPGTYNFFAFGPGANGQLSLTNYATVTAANTTVLGTVNWIPTRVAPTVWEMGTPDRTASEFKHGTDWWTSNIYPNPNWAKFMDYISEFPNDVDFTIGQNNIATDWNFVQPSNNNVPVSNPTWNVNFNLATAPVTGSTASVYVALAANFNAALILSVNGVNVTSPSTGIIPGNDTNAMIRKGIHGAFAEVRFNFPASNLHAGVNKISFSLRKTGGATSGEVMYDYVRLEASGSTLSTDSFEKSDLVKAYPNPTNNTVTLNIPDTSVLEKVMVYNSLGQLVSVVTKNTVSLENLDGGNYYLLIVTSTGNYVKKIIIQ